MWKKGTICHDNLTTAQLILRLTVTRKDGMKMLQVCRILCGY